MTEAIYIMIFFLTLTLHDEFALGLQAHLIGQTLNKLKKMGMVLQAMLLDMMSIVAS